MIGSDTVGTYANAIAFKAGTAVGTRILNWVSQKCMHEARHGGCRVWVSTDGLPTGMSDKARFEIDASCSTESVIAGSGDETGGPSRGGSMRAATRIEGTQNQGPRTQTQAEMHGDPHKYWLALSI